MPCLSPAAAQARQRLAFILASREKISQDQSWGVMSGLGRVADGVGGAWQAVKGNTLGTAYAAISPNEDIYRYATGTQSAGNTLRAEAKQFYGDAAAGLQDIGRVFTGNGATSNYSQRQQVRSNRARSQGDHRMAAALPWADRAGEFGAETALTLGAGGLAKQVAGQGVKQFARTAVPRAVNYTKAHPVKAARGAAGGYVASGVPTGDAGERLADIGHGMTGAATMPSSLAADAARYWTGDPTQQGLDYTRASAASMLRGPQRWSGTEPQRGSNYWGDAGSAYAGNVQPYIAGQRFDKATGQVVPSMLGHASEQLGRIANRPDSEGGNSWSRTAASAGSGALSAADYLPAVAGAAAMPGAGLLPKAHPLLTARNIAGTGVTAPAAIQGVVTGLGEFATGAESYAARQQQMQEGERFARGGDSAAFGRNIASGQLENKPELLAAGREAHPGQARVADDLQSIRDEGVTPRPGDEAFARNEAAEHDSILPSELGDVTAAIEDYIAENPEASRADVNEAVAHAESVMQDGDFVALRDAVAANGQLPEQEQEGLVASISAEIGLPAKQAWGAVQKMDPLWQLALLALGSIGTLGLINSFMGRATATNLFATIFGLGGAAGLIANEGGFGQGGQDMVQQLLGMIGLGGEQGPPAEQLSPEQQAAMSMPTTEDGQPAVTLEDMAAFGAEHGIGNINEFVKKNYGNPDKYLPLIQKMTPEQARFSYQQLIDSDEYKNGTRRYGFPVPAETVQQSLSGVLQALHQQATAA